MDEQGIPASLTQPAASFVTLNIGGELRGCIGSLEARRPLLDDVASNAFAAAFRDPRFPPLSNEEYGVLELHISLLAPSTPMDISCEEELLSALRPGVDGLILEDPPYRSVFLPQVWETLPEPVTFVNHLKLKAGLPADHWSDELRFSRFTVEEISGEDSPERETS
jgi:AmmeMemoRadiSam system protein A